MIDAIKRYYWTIVPPILFVIIVVFLKYDFESENFLKATLFAITFPLLAATLLAVIEVKVFGRYYSNINKKIAKLFNAKIEAKNLSKTKIGRYDIYILTNVFSNCPIEFHIPRNQIDKMKHKPKFKFQESKINNFNTYLICKSTSFFVKNKKQKIERIINEVSIYK